MFKGCAKLMEIKGMNKFDTKNVKNMAWMFQGCSALEYLDLSNFNTSNVDNMNAMFGSCTKLKEIKGINNFDTSNARNIAEIFMACLELEYLDLSNFNVSNAGYIGNMF